MVDWLCQHFLHISFTVLCEWFVFKCLMNKEPLPLPPPLPPVPLPHTEAESDVALAPPCGEEEACCCEAHSGLETDGGGPGAHTAAAPVTQEQSR